MPIHMLKKNALSLLSRVAALALPLALAGLVACKDHDHPLPREGALVPLAAIMGDPREGERIEAPGGELVAFRGPSGGNPPHRLNLFVAGTGARAAAPRQITFERDRDVHGVRWLSSSRLAYGKDPVGDENFRLFAVNADGSGALELTPRDLRSVDCELICPDPAGANRWLVAMGPAHRLRDLYSIDVVTGDCALKERNTERLVHIVPDSHGRILLGLALDGLRLTLKHRPDERSPFRTVITTTYPDQVLPVALEPDGRSARVLANVGRDTLALYSLDLATGSLGALLMEKPGLDLLGPEGRARTRLLALLGRPGAEAPTGPRIVHYHARDGEPIMALLTLPPVGTALPAPAVILCHGGPEAMTRPDPEEVFLASRGLVVLQPHFRGSAGTGKRFMALGHGQWGGTMQDDLTDGANWLVALGLADPARLGIMGGSYGGFAALAGAALTPDLFRCAVAVNGPSDLLSFLASPMGLDHAEQFRLRVGDPVRDGARLRAVSPLHNAHHIHIPLLVGHGAQDSRVPVAESDRLVRALEARGVFVPYYRVEDEGHSYWVEEHRLAWYRAVENFFGLHLGSRVEAPSPIPLLPSDR